jgi:pimeloyl-ACP methyl ester carboxylesterase
MSIVEFGSGGVRCVGVHLPGEGADFTGRDGRRPCVVLANGFGGTVDAGLEPYVERFAAAGVDALAFDYRHFGSSDGEPRQLLSIARQLQDYAAAIAFARSLDGVDPDRIVVWGSSYAGGHVIPVAVADGKVAAAIAQVPAMDGVAALINAARHAGPGHLAKLTLAGLRDLAAALRGRAPVMMGLVGPPGSVAAMTTPDAEPGYRAIAGPSWRNEVAARIALTTSSYRPGLQADRLPCPILVQIADRDAIAPPKAAQDAAWRATGRAEVRTYPIGHFDIYVGEPFERAIADQLHFLRRHVGAPADGRVQPGETLTTARPRVGR